MPSRGKNLNGTIHRQLDDRIMSIENKITAPPPCLAALLSDEVSNDIADGSVRFGTMDLVMDAIQLQDKNRVS